MSISFNQISASILTPGQYVEFDNSAAVSGVQLQPHRVLLIGPRRSSGTATEGQLKTIRTEEDGDLYFGAGAVLALMCRAFRQVNTVQECVAIALDEDGAGTAATQTVGFAGTATAAGQLVCNVGGVEVTAAIASGTTAAQAATALAAAINAATGLPVTGAASTVTTTLTFRHKGAIGNDLPLVRMELPAGLTATVAVGATGATNPDISAALTAVGDSQYQTIAIAFTDADNLELLEAHLERKWGPMVAAEGHAFAALAGAHADLVELGEARNSPWVTLLVAGTSLTPTWIWTATMAAVEAGQADPALPRQTLELPDVLAPDREDDYTRDQREQLLQAGLATFIPDFDRKMRVERLVTTYKTNSSGAPDPSYRDLETMRTLAAIRYAVRTRIATKFPRYKLASDGVQGRPGQQIVTPTVIKMELIALMRDLEGIGWVENVDAWKSTIRVERSSSDANRLDAFLPPDIINQFRVFAASIQFRL